MSPAAAYLRFEVRRALRNKQYLTMTVALPTVFYLVFSRGDGGAFSPRAASVAVYFLGSMAVFGAVSASLFGAVNLSVERTSGWGEQLRVTPLTARSYVTVKVLTRLVLVLPAVGLVSAAGVLVSHVDVNILRVLAMLPAITLGSLPFVCLGVAIGSHWAPETAQAASTGANILLSLLGGLWMPIDGLPRVLQALGSTLPSHHLAQLSRGVLRGPTPSLASLAALIVWTCVTALVATHLYRRAETQPA